MKFSIIVPVYNVEKYILKCLESIENQSYQNYEVIIVDDGSKDNSFQIIKDYIQNKPQYLYHKKENGGLSDARNYGIKYVTGDYIIFLDSDDYLNQGLLSTLNKQLSKNNVDIIKYNMQEIKENEKGKVSNISFSNLKPDEAIPLLLKDQFFETACTYCYKTSFWTQHNFKYSKGKLHEDFGLTPLILMQAKSISSIPYVGYNYIIRENSIMTSSDAKKNHQKYQDCLYFFKNNTLKINECSNINNHTKKILCSFYANGIINRLKYLSKEDYNNELKYLKEIKAFDYLIEDNIKQKLKKFCYKKFPKIFIKRKDKK